MKLYEAKGEIKIYAEIADGSKYMTHKVMDGMFSSCKTENGKTVFLEALTELEEFKDGYKIVSPKKKENG